MPTSSTEGVYPGEGIGSLLRDQSLINLVTEKILAEVSKTADKSMQGVWPKFSLRYLSKELFGKDFSGERQRIFAGHTGKALLALATLLCDCARGNTRLSGSLQLYSKL